MLRIVEINSEFSSLVEDNGGYCPCAVIQDEDTKCPCKEFREQNEPGPCACGRYEKVEV